MTSPYRQRSIITIVLGLLLMALAGYGLYEAIITLLSGLPLQGPAGATLRDSLTSVTIMIIALCLAAVILVLVSFSLIRKEIGRRHRTEEKMSHLAQTAELAGDLITIAHRKGKIEYVNKAVESVTGYSLKDLVGKRNDPWLPWYRDDVVLQEMLDTVLSGDPFQAVVNCQNKQGGSFIILEQVTPLLDRKGNITRFVSTARDITRQKQLEDRIDYLDKYDPLTGASNRRHFAERLKRELESSQREDRFLSVLIMDIDRFKYINDLFGSDVGDEVLQRISETLRASVSEGDVVARLGSDEFGVIHHYSAQLIDTAAVAEHIRNTVSQNILIGGQDIVLTVTIGIANYPDSGRDSRALLKNADMALSRAKSRGRNTVQVFSPDIDRGIQEFYLMEKRLFSALKNDEYHMKYQPYCDLSTKRISGAEALIRWSNGEIGIVPPSKFIPTLEETGLIIDVGQWVLRTACRQIRDWKRNNRNVAVSVNLSHLQFRHRDFIDIVSEAIKDLAIDPRYLTLELTESICIHDMDLTITRMKKLKDAGVSISVDDFGTGYSSLNYIKKLPVDNLKIDMSFIREVAKDPDAASIVTAITGMARSLSLKTIAEGVETEEQRNILHLLRCDMGQGFYFSPAVTAADFDKLLMERSTSGPGVR